jgi:hypothetical protein
MTSADWIDTLDRCRLLPAMLRPCALLDGARDAAEGTAQSMPLGQRDAQLLDLQQALFGPTLDALAQCPQCNERLELSLHVADLRLPDVPGLAVTEPVVCVAQDGYHLRSRLPNSQDLAAVAEVKEMHTARATLLQRCLIDATHAGQPLAAHMLPDALMQQLDAAMRAADPQADTELALQCPACTHGWTEPFDIGSYLLSSLEQWSERCLDQVHTLARAYGWTEAQILALSPARRARYIERVLA